MSAILLDNTFQTSSPFMYNTIDELLRQRAPLLHDCLFQLFHSFIAVHSLLQVSPVPTLRSLDCLLSTSQAR